MEGDDFDWKPPSEAELKVLQARRERSDKISKLMGDYLLKGYRMLGSCCSVCGTILLRDRQQQDYCVCCSELDTDLAKDDPAVSAKAARSQVEEHEMSVSATNQKPSSKTTSSGNDHSSSVTPPGKRPRQNGFAHRPQCPQSRAERAERVLPNKPQRLASNPHQYENHLPGRVLDLPAGSPDIVHESMEVVMGKLFWATQQLKGTASVEGSTQLCTLIKACADAMTSLRYLVPGELTD